MSHRLNPYLVVLMWMADACGDDIESERQAALWFAAWHRSINDENEREGQ